MIFKKKNWIHDMLVDDANDDDKHNFVVVFNQSSLYSSYIDTLISFGWQEKGWINEISYHPFNLFDEWNELQDLREKDQNLCLTFITLLKSYQ